MLTFATPFEKRDTKKFFEKIEKVQEASTEQDKSRSVDSFLRIKLSGRAKNYMRYTMKSLILAQDER